MKMEWTFALPKTAGFYFWQGDMLKGKEVGIIQVTSFRDETLPLHGDLLVLSSGGVIKPKHGNIAIFGGGKWWGPIQTPHDL
jgi:hypothetical protein